MNASLKSYDRHGTPPPFKVPSVFIVWKRLREPAIADLGRRYLGSVAWSTHAPTKSTERKKVGLTAIKRNPVDGFAVGATAVVDGGKYLSVEGPFCMLLERPATPARKSI
jgi:hypothetical protein